MQETVRKIFPATKCNQYNSALMLVFARFLHVASTQQRNKKYMNLTIAISLHLSVPVPTKHFAQISGPVELRPYNMLRNISVSRIF